MEKIQLDADDYFKLVQQTFREQGNPDVAQGQMAYMKHQFGFFGLKAPVWTALAKDIYQKYTMPDGEDLKAFVRMCFEDEHREMQYFGIETVQKMQKKQDADFILFLEELVLEKSWWDTVDWLAKLVGIHFVRFPEQIKPVTERWMQSGNMWLQRVSMIFQLFYREKTDKDLMFAYISRLIGSKEFFIQKGAGWALRQYSRTNPTAVREFIESTPGLAPLTKREGLRLME